MELCVVLRFYLIALRLRLPIWKEGGLIMGGMQAVARMHRGDSSREWIGSDVF